MTPEDRLRDALHAKARQFDAAPDLRDGAVSLAVARQRRRRLQLAAGSALAAAAAVAVVIAAVAAFDREPSRTLEVRPADTTTTELAPSTTVAEEAVAPSTTAPAASKPEVPSFLVAADHKRLVVLNSTTGKVIRTLVQLPADNGEPECCGGIGDISLSPERKTVYFHRIGEPGAGQIQRVAVAGGPVETIVQNADLLDISPDGRKLAYRKGNSGLAVHDLSTGAEKDWTVFGGHEQVGRFAWAPDSRRLAVTLAFDSESETGDGVHTTVRLLDTESAPLAVADAPAIDIPRTNDHPDLSVGAWRGDSGDLMVIRYCCWPEASGGQELVTFRDGAVGSSTQVAGSIGDLDYDPTGTFRLMGVYVGEMGVGHQELRWAGDGRSGTFGAWDHAVW
jgi:hypothetical protein